MIPHLSHVMTLANSVIGVSVLAMPFCFKQCGIVLAALVLLLSSALSRLACHFLIKSAVMSRRRNFEFLAFHAFGRTGKFLVELFIIGFLLGTCIAFFVVVGDLGPEIVGKMLNKKPEDIRTSLLVTTGTFIVLPLGLLRNIDSLSSVCTATIGFYLCLVVKVIGESTRHIFLGDWYNRVMYWRPGGILQCLPIFAMALFCQTQLFDIYEAIPNVCLEKMNQVVRGALNICTMVYLCVGFFGYVAFCTQPFTGNILMSFEPSLTSDLIKMGFVFSVAFSFPLVIFPCRASLNSLLFRRAHTHEPSNYYIPETRFRCLTVTIVAISLGTGILIPNIEFVLGIVGSTIGVMICLIFPAAFFIAISTKNTNERLLAQAILLFGMSIMVLGTYANLYAMEDSSSGRAVIATGEPLDRMSDILPFKSLQNLPNVRSQLEEDTNKEKIENPVQEVPQTNGETIDVRREPPIPMERNADPATVRSAVKEILSPIDGPRVTDDTKTSDGQQRNEIIADSVDQQRNENLIHSDAIKKEESELAAAGVQANNEPAYEKLRQTLEKHKLEQMEMMQEQKKLLKDIKEQAQVLEMEKKRLAMEQIRRKDDNFEPNKSPVQARILDDGALSDPNKKINNETNGVESPNDSLRSRDSRGPILNALTSRRNETRDEGPRKSLELALPIALHMRNQTNGDEKSSLTVKAGVDRENRSSLTVVDKPRREDRSSLTVKGNSDREDSPSLTVKGDADRENGPSSMVKVNAHRETRSSLTVKDKSDQEDSPSLTVKGQSYQEDSPSLMVKDKSDQEDSPSLTVKGQSYQEDSPSLMVKGKSDQEDSPSLTVKGKSDQEDSPSLTVKGQSYQEDSPSLMVKGKSDQEDSPSLMVKGKSDQEDSPSLTVKGKSGQEDSPSLTVKGKSDQEDSPSVTVNGKSDQQDSPSLTVKGKSDQQDSPSLTVKGKSDQEDSPPLTVKGKSDQEDSPPLTVKGKSDQEDSPPLTVKGKSDQKDSPSLTVKGKSDQEDSPSLTVKGKSDQEDSPSLMVKGKSDQEDSPSLTVKGKSYQEDSPSLTVKGKSDQENSPSLTVKGKSDQQNSPSLMVKDNFDWEGGQSLTVKGNSDREDRPAMRRDILEQPESDKREKREAADEIFPERKFDVDECRRKVDEIKESINIPTTDVISIRTNVYLADQGFADKKVTLGPGDNAVPVDEVSSGLSMLKKRDLKALIRERRR